MLILAIAVAAYAVVRAAACVLDSLRALPRSNEDWVWY